MSHPIIFAIKVSNEFLNGWVDLYLIGIFSHATLYKSPCRSDRLSVSGSVTLSCLHFLSIIKVNKVVFENLIILRTTDGQTNGLNGTVTYSVAFTRLMAIDLVTHHFRLPAYCKQHLRIHKLIVTFSLFRSFFMHAIWEPN